MKKIFMSALAAVAILASCSKDGDNGTNSQQSGEATTMGLSFTMPNLGGRADGDDVTAIASENTVNSVQVFIFTSAGVYDSQVGYAEFNSIATEFTQSGTTYTLKAANAITANTGAKRIYVGINLPASFKGKTNVASEDDLLDKVKSFALSDLTGTGISMISAEAAVKTLVAKPEGTTDVPAANTVPTTVTRMVAKVMAQTGNSTMAYTPSYNAGTPAISFDVKYDIKGYALAQGSNKMFTVQKLVSGVLVTPTPTSVNLFEDAPLTETDFVAMNNDAKNFTNGTYIYTGENAPASGLVKESTYMLVKTLATPAKQASVVSDAIALTNWTANVDNDMWIVRGKLGEVFFCSNTTDANAVALKCQGTFVLYPGSYVYFLVWLNLNINTTYQSDLLNIYRNQFIHVTINGISGTTFSGTPGTIPTDGEDPTDPTDPTDPNNPEDVPDPEDPVIVKPTSMLVEVTLKPWTYIGNTVILGE